MPPPPNAPAPGAQRWVLKRPLQGAVFAPAGERVPEEKMSCVVGGGETYWVYLLLRVCQKQRWDQQKRATARSDLVPVPKCHLHKGGELTGGGTPDNFEEE